MRVCYWVTWNHGTTPVRGDLWFMKKEERCVDDDDLSAEKNDCSVLSAKFCPDDASFFSSEFIKKSLKKMKNLINYLFKLNEKIVWSRI